MEFIKSLFRPVKVVKIKRPNYIPFEIQSEIIKSLPVKSLIRFRSVSKPWKSLIDSSEFIAEYNLRCKEQHLLVRYIDLEENKEKYVSIVDDDDDDIFPRHKVSVTAPMSFELYKKQARVGDSDQYTHDIIHNRPTILGSSQGLFCLFTYYGVSNEHKAVLWNPSIRKSVHIVVPNLRAPPRHNVVGFGVCPQTRDPKLVKITSMGESTVFPPWQVEVFTLSSKTWRGKSSNLPCKSIHLTGDQVVIDRFIYWLAFDKVDPDVPIDWYELISFDLTSEEFTETEIYLPDGLTYEDNLSISNLRESLVVLKTNKSTDKEVFGVWMMDHQ